MIKIDILKNNSQHIPLLSNIWYQNIGRKWSPNVSIKEIECWMKDWLNEDIPLAFIARHKNLPIGMCSLQFNDGLNSELKPWLGDLCVDKGYQKLGVAKLLIHATETKAAQLGYDKIFLFTPDPTLPLYYGRMGWNFTGNDRYNGHPVTIMHRDLGNLSSRFKNNKRYTI